MKLLTLNCHSWQEENQIEKIQYLAKVIQEEEYDVIALQEVSQSIQAENVCGNKKEDNFGLLLLEELKALHVKITILLGISLILVMTCMKKD